MLYQKHIIDAMVLMGGKSVALQNGEQDPALFIRRLKITLKSKATVARITSAPFDSEEQRLAL
jgi:hypothetical protein